MRRCLTCSELIATGSRCQQCAATNERTRRAPASERYGPEWRTTRKRILDRDNWLCHWCGSAAATVDHLTPRAHGGTHTEDNLAACCAPCNSTRGGSQPKGIMPAADH